MGQRGKEKERERKKETIQSLTSSSSSCCSDLSLSPGIACCSGSHRQGTGQRKPVGCGDCVQARCDASLDPTVHLRL